ncbi:MAG: hypothetical protein D4R74_07795 [Betaproteobacteria bacterium]|nr:MAG: hypothetical protein D4R74_07795 [Betaproteobacteria bacterium]
MSNITVTGEKLIARPIDVVQTQFVDFAHHERTRVHRDLEVKDARPVANGFRFTGRRRVFGMLQVDEIEVLRHPDGNSTLRSLSGTNVGLTVEQTFESRGPESTLVRLEVNMPVSGFLALLSPLVRVGIQRDLAIGLEEDRIDLEERRYTKSEAAH